MAVLGLRFCARAFCSFCGFSSGGHSSSWHAGLSLSRPLLLRSTGSAVVAHGPSCSAACGIFPDEGLNPCPLHWQADSQPLHHQGSPISSFKGILPIGCASIIIVLTMFYGKCIVGVYNLIAELFIITKS